MEHIGTREKLYKVKQPELDTASGNIVARNLSEEYSIFDIAVLFD